MPYTPDQAAQMLGISRNTMYRDIAAGRIVAYPVGSRGIRITDAAIKAYQSRQLSDRIRVDKHTEETPRQRRASKDSLTYVPGMRVV